ncbi:MAG: glycosyltransferase family 4 protein, partial [Phycisphaerae bacterium]
PVMLESSWQAAVYRRMRFFAPMQLVPLRIDEYLACRRADKVVVVADEHIPRIRKLGATLEDILVVTNTEDVDYFDGLEIDESVVERFRDDFVILYVGGFGPQRGLDVAIRAMPSILESIPNARFVLVGSGIIQSELEALAEQLELGDRVTFEGHQPFERLPSYIRTSRVCLIPHISTPNVETGMPNKIFQFMILGRPIVISSIRPMMRVVDDARCGLVFEDRNPESLAEKVIELKDPALRRRLGENGRRAVERRYNWKTSVQPVLRVYREWNDARGAAYGK